MRMLWKTGEKNGILGQSILKNTERRSISSEKGCKVFALKRKGRNLSKQKLFSEGYGCFCVRCEMTYVSVIAGSVCKRVPSLM